MNLTKEDLIRIHGLVEDRFKATITPGIRSMSLVESIVQRPDRVVHKKVCYPDIYSKAASIMEAMRWHAFIDGNKRTLLLATQAYLKKNGYFCLFPLKAVKFSVEISATKDQDPKSIDQLIEKISLWLKDYVADRNDSVKVKSVILRDFAEVQKLKELNERDPRKANEQARDWLAMDIYPENKEEYAKILELIKDMTFESIDSLESG